jgi:hypothetical protein
VKFVIDKKVPSASQCWDLFSVLVVMKPKKLTGVEIQYLAPLSSAIALL